MIVLWRKIEDHVELFRNSKGVQEWRAAIGPFLKQPGEIFNFGEPVVSAGAKLPSGGGKAPACAPGLTRWRISRTPYREHSLPPI